MTSKIEYAKEYVNRSLEASKKNDLTPILNTLFVVAAMVAFQQKMNLTTPQMFFIAAVVFAGLKSIEMIVDASSKKEVGQEEQMTTQQKIFAAANPTTLLTVAAAVGALRGEREVKEL